MGSSSSGVDARRDDGQESIARRRSKRVIRQPDKYVACVNYGDLDSIAFSLATREDIDTKDPQSYKEAAVSKEATNWLMAMNEEMQSSEKNETWDLVLVPKEKKLAW